MEHWRLHEGTWSILSFLLDLISNLSVTGTLLWLEADMKAERSQLSAEEKIANLFQRVLSHGFVKLSCFNARQLGRSFRSE
jgi:hypothetical protein